MTPEVRTARAQLATARSHASRAAYLRSIGLDAEAEAEVAEARTAVAAVTAAASQSQTVAAQAAATLSSATAAATTARAELQARQAELPPLQDAVGMAVDGVDTALDAVLVAPDFSVAATFGLLTVARTARDTAVTVLQDKINETNTAAEAVGSTSEAALTAGARSPIAQEGARITTGLAAQADAIPL